jgi:hypothetical protein
VSCAILTKLLLNQNRVVRIAFIRAGHVAGNLTPMRAVYIIGRFVQLSMLIPVGLGIGNAGSFFELLNGIAHGQPWDFAKFAERFALFSSPTGLGVAVIVLLELVARNDRQTRALTLRHPEEPWLWKPQWAARRIRLSNRKFVASFGAVLGVFCFVIVPLGLWIATLAAAEAAKVVYVVLGVVGTILMLVTRGAWLNRRWGTSELELLTLPGVIGGSFRGIVTLSQALPVGTALRVTLKCLRLSSSTNSSGDTSLQESTDWQSQKILLTAQSMLRSNSVAVPCSFAIPKECEPTTVESKTGSEGESDSIQWVLSVGMKDTLDPRHVVFEVPVFQTKGRPPDDQEDLAADAAYLEPVDVNALLASIPLERKSTASGERLRFSFMRPRDFVLFLAFTLAISLGVWAIFRYLSMPLAAAAALLPGVLAIACCVALVKAVTWRSEIEIAPRTTTFTAGYIWSRRRFEYLTGQKVPLECRAVQYREDRSVYCISLMSPVPGSGPLCDIVKRLDGEQNAVALRDWLVTLIRTSKSGWKSPKTPRPE